MMTPMQQYPCKHCAQHHAFDGVATIDSAETVDTIKSFIDLLISSSPSSKSPHQNDFGKLRDSEEAASVYSVGAVACDSKSSAATNVTAASFAANSTRKKDRCASKSIADEATLNFGRQNARRADFLANRVDHSHAMSSINHHHHSHYLHCRSDDTIDQQQDHNRIIGNTGADQWTCRLINCSTDRCNSRTIKTTTTTDKLMQNDHQIPSISGVKMPYNSDQNDRNKHNNVTIQTITSTPQFYQPPTRIQSALADQWPKNATENVFLSNCPADISTTERSRQTIKTTTITATTPHRCQQTEPTVFNVQNNNESQIKFKFETEANQMKTENGKRRRIGQITEENCKQATVSAAPTTIAACTFAHVLLFCFVFVAFGMGGHRSSNVCASEYKNSTIGKFSSTAGICQSRDIRNSPDMFRQLEGCRVIEGFLMISLVDKYNESHYENLEFPLLTEITDFLLVYRVNGLKTLMKLFPNLRLIRGNSLIKDYALIIYEMMHLTEIGLKSLTQITRGGVRIEKNAMLCYVDTIDWSAIAAGSTEIFIANNKPQNECPICSSVNSTNDVSDKDSVRCPPAKTDPKKGLCWNRQNCQKVCPAQCGNRSCSKNGKCCDEACLSCSDVDQSKCDVCRYLSIGDFTSTQCVQKCPQGKFKHENRRCIGEQECRAVQKPTWVNFDYNVPKQPYIPFEGECLIDCPTDFYPDGESGKRECKKCVGKCKKECTTGTIDSIAAAQRYRGCTHINGSLTIQIRSQGGQNVIKELELALADVEQIDGSLRIARSFPIVSLNFFKKLVRIKGNILESDRYAIYVMDNQNIQSLFPQNVTIDRGKLFFHFNPKLCPAVIDELKPFVRDLRGVDQFAPEDVAKNSNGDKVACTVTILNATMKNIRSLGAIIQLQPMVYEDERSLLGYVVYYMPAPAKNVTLYDGRDACGGDGWKVEDVQNVSHNSSVIEVFLTHLKPYTQYAYYIKTYTIASEQRGGQTNIQYFRTNPDKPDIIRKLVSVANSSSEISITWEPPKRSNGNLTTYVIIAEWSLDDADLLEQRNYCNEPLGQEKQQIPAAVVPDIKPTGPKQPQEPTCDCEEYSPDSGTKISDGEAELVIAFENELHNTIYVKRPPESYERRRREIRYSREVNEGASLAYANDNHNSSSIIEAVKGATGVYRTSNGTHTNKTINGDGLERNEEDSILVNNTYGRFYRRFYKEVNVSTLSYVIRDLRHFSLYQISVLACRESAPTDFTEKIDNCSTEVIVHQRTRKIDGADTILSLTVEKEAANNSSLGGVRLHWSIPSNPNGIILSYTIRYQRVDIEHSKPQENCITHKYYKSLSNGYSIKHLVNGNYTFSVMATTLAGPGEWSALATIIVNESTITPRFIIGMVFLAILIIVLAVGGFWYFRRKYGPPDAGLKLIASVNPEYVSMQYTPDEWEVPREKIIQLSELGQGSFGMVYEGIVNNLDRDNERIRCAIKTVNDNATDRERINFLKEAAVMKAFDTHHVVRLLGVVSRGQPTLVIMELMANGDLKGYLRSHRPEAENPGSVQPPSLRRILQMSIEIADGMAYLAAKKFVHRDLAARNCMVAEDLTVKIGDFGMTRDIYETDYYRKGTKGLLPVRWMAPESLKDGVFSTTSDVFSFGIVLWEMATLASQPYQGLSNDQVLRYVIDGGVMERPENCPEKLYNMMIKCWQHRPSGRPTFIQIVTMLLDDASPNFRALSFYYSQPGQELLLLPQHQLLEVVDVRTPLRAEEENFSVGGEEEDPEDPNSFLMEKTNLGQNAGPSHSPLRHSGTSLTIDHNITNIPDVALNQSRNDNSTVTIIEPSHAASILQPTSAMPSLPPPPGHGRNGLNRGLGFLRNTLFGHGHGGTDVSNGGNNGSGSGGACDSKDYKLLNHSINSQPEQYIQRIK